MYEAIEEAYTLEQPEPIEDLRDHLVKPAIPQITSLFASSWCMTCYGGRHQTPAWRWSRFDTVAPLLCEVSHEAHKKPEDHQAIVILEKQGSKLMAHHPTGSSLDCQSRTEGSMRDLPIWSETPSITSSRTSLLLYIRLYIYIYTVIPHFSQIIGTRPSCNK